MLNDRTLPGKNSIDTVHAGHSQAHLGAPRLLAVSEEGSQLHSGGDGLVDALDQGCDILQAQIQALARHGMDRVRGVADQGQVRSYGVLVLRGQMIRQGKGKLRRDDLLNQRRTLKDYGASSVLAEQVGLLLLCCHGTSILDCLNDSLNAVTQIQKHGRLLFGGLRWK